MTTQTTPLMQTTTYNGFQEQWTSTLFYNSEWNIYDCFFSGSGDLVIICPGEIRPNPKIWLLIPGQPDKEFFADICPGRHTYVYRLSNHNLGQNTENISIKISNMSENNVISQIIHIKPNKYPSCQNQIVMATMVKNENNILRTWIDFHARLGVHKFIIYDNFGSLETAEGNYINNQPLDTEVFQKRSPLFDLLSDYIQSGKVILINWPYTKFLKISGVSGQTTQQNHAIRAFDTADWIGLFDVDEFVNIQRPDIILRAKDGEGMRRFLDGIVRKTPLGKQRIGALLFKNKFFYNPDELPINKGGFLEIPNCAKGIKQLGNEKNFVIPRNVRTFAIHMITSGQKTIVVPPILGYFNHYIYLNKPSRGRDQTPWRDSSITRYLPVD